MVKHYTMWDSLTGFYMYMRAVIIRNMSRIVRDANKTSNSGDFPELDAQGKRINKVHNTSLLSNIQTNSYNLRWCVGG